MYYNVVTLFQMKQFIILKSVSEWDKMLFERMLIFQMGIFLMFSALMRQWQCPFRRFAANTLNPLCWGHQTI